MNTHDLICLALCVLCFLAGAYLDHRFGARAAVAAEKERAELTAGWKELATKAHDERDAIFAKFGASKAPPAAAEPPKT